MTVKIIRKILAVAIAAATVVAMPGLASANPKQGKDSGSPKNSAEKELLGKKRNHSNEESEEEENKNKIESVEGCFNLLKDEDDDGSKLGTEHFYTAAINSITILKDYFNKPVLEATNRIRDLKRQGDLETLKDCSIGQKSKLMNMLVDWSKDDDVKHKMNIALAIGDLAENGFFVGCCNDQKSAIMGALIDCFNSDSSNKSSFVWAARRLKEIGFLNANDSPQALNLKKILDDCALIEDVEPEMEPEIKLDAEDFDDLEI